MKRELKLSRRADRSGQDSLVLLNRELQQVEPPSQPRRQPLLLLNVDHQDLMSTVVFFQENNDLKSKNRSLTVQMRDLEEVLTKKVTEKSKDMDVKYMDSIVNENSHLKEEVSFPKVFIFRCQEPHFQSRKPFLASANFALTLNES